MIKTKLDEIDIYPLIQLGKELFQESRFNNHEFDPVGIEQILRATLRVPDKCFIAYDDSYRGVILMGMSKHYFSDCKWATDFAFYVLPEYRGSSLASELIQRAEDWATENGASEITILHNTGIKTESAKRFFNGVGYETNGLIFSKELKCVV